MITITKILQDILFIIPFLLTKVYKCNITSIMNTRFYLFIIASLLFCQLSAQNSVFKTKKELNWAAAPEIHSPMGIRNKELWTFTGSARHPQSPALPVANFRFSVPGKGKLNVTVSDTRYESFSQLSPSDAGEYVQANPAVNSRISKNRDQYFGNVSLLPIRQTADGQFQKLVAFQINVTYTEDGLSRTPPPPPNTFNSVLGDGMIYKIGVNADGIHKLDYDFLKNELKIDIDNINPKQIKIYGNGGGMLPEPVLDFREDDLVENHIQIIGADDNSFDPADYILFYAQGPHKWIYNEARFRFDRPQNAYDKRNYYFIKISSGNGVRVSNANSVEAPAYTVTSFDDFDRLEEDRVNVLGSLARGGLGTGKIWYGDQFNPTRSRDYVFQFPNLIANEESDVAVAMALRGTSSSHYLVNVAGESFRSGNASGVDFSAADAIFARRLNINKKFSGGTDRLVVNVENPPSGNQANEAFMDYVQVNVRRQLIMSGAQMRFLDARVKEFPNATYEVRGITANHQIWDITDPLRPKVQQGTNSGGSFRFGVNIPFVNPIKTFIAFNKQQEFPVPDAIGAIPTQNIHGIAEADMIIVYHSEFESAVQRLADHRRRNDNLNVVPVLIDQIYNEFSSGRQDPSAIRDFVGMVHRRDNSFKYLLLFGDGTYDYRQLSNDQSWVNFIPVYETDEHLNPIEGFPADDYFALVSDDDGNTLAGDVDLAIGRIPARSAFEADRYIDKIIFYDTDPKRLRDWRNQITFVGDDGDGEQHMNQANTIADTVVSQYDYFNVDKILFDAYQRVTTAGGIRFPQVSQSLNRNAYRGSLVTNYLGHGGPTGWAQERVLQIVDIEGWRNFERLPLIVTATCSFAGYDDHDVIPGGEVAVMKPDGGAIAMYTTVRAVYSSSNFRLTKSVFNRIFEATVGDNASIGEIFRQAKNNSAASVNNTRKFTLLGDPSQKLAIPQYNVGTLTINGRSVNQGSQSDTLRALEKVTVTGYIYDNDGNRMTDFNGRVYPTIYDKVARISTLGQNENEPFDFDLQKNVLFKGTATVQDGLFTFEFITPKDIDYNYGFGKISYYAEDGVRDAKGLYKKIVIGGTSPNAVRDDKGPQVKVFMNTEEFVSGGTTDKDPVLLVNLEDDFGINIGGVSIGHDLTGVLDDNTQDTYVLNDFYTAALDDYSKGTVRFPLYDVAEGLHRITVKAWDTSNNSGEGSTEFLVFNSEESALKHVLNYPNPFTTNTNFQFEHQLSGQDLNIMVQIFTVSGKLVKTIEKDTYADGYRVTDVGWDGKDDYGDRLGRGVYLYKIKVKAANSKDENTRTESEFEKLVILK